MEAHAELQEDHHPAECEQCKVLNAEKQEKQAMVEAGLAEASDSSDADDRHSETEGAHGTSHPMHPGQPDKVDDVDEARIIRDMGGALSVCQMPSDPEQQQRVLSPDGAMAVVVDGGQRRVFLPDSALSSLQQASAPDAEDPSAVARANSWFHRPSPSPMLSLVSTDLIAKQSDRISYLDLAFASKDDVIPSHVVDDPRALHHIVPAPVFSRLGRVQEACRQYLGRTTDVARVRRAFAARDWQLLELLAQNMDRHQQVAAERDAATQRPNHIALAPGPSTSRHLLKGLGSASDTGVLASMQFADDSA